MSLCREDGLYYPCETLTAEWRISRVPAEELQGLEVSVLWHTEGKGDEDFHVHHFYRLSENQIRSDGLTDASSTECELPATPLSYQGKLISVCWCIRLRLFLVGGREIVSEQPFYLINPTMVSRSELSQMRATHPGETHSDIELATPPDSNRSVRAVKRFSGPSSAT